MQRVIITATMITGEQITETAEDFGRFVDLVLSFRRDSDCKQISWVAVADRGAKAAA